VQADHQAVLAAALGGLVMVLADQGGDRAGQLVGEGGAVGAEAKRISLSMAKVASRCLAAAAPVMSSPTSRTSLAASASSQRADSWSGDRAGSGATAASAVGEIT
jgi:hypothetical protein